MFNVDIISKMSHSPMCVRLVDNPGSGLLVTISKHGYFSHPIIIRMTVFYLP